ncbi:MAG: SGNH/GDSL hydrolase family protein [Bacteroidales bacterium]
MNQDAKKFHLLWYILYVLGLVIVIDLLTGIFLIPRSYSSFRTLHPVYHHGLLKNKETLAAWGPLVYPFTTNSLGFRDEKVRKVPPTIHNKRILVLGDSHTEAVGINFEDSFFGILSAAARVKNIDMLNGAVVSYSPKIHYLKTKYLLEEAELKFNELWVFLDLSDLQNELAYEAFEPQPETVWWRLSNGTKKFLIAHSFLYSTFFRIADKKRVDAFYESMRAFDEMNQQKKSDNIIELYSTFFKDFNDKDMIRNPAFHGVGLWYSDSATFDLAEKGIRLGQENMKKLADLCRENQIKLKISVHPWQPQVSAHDTSDYYVNSWRSFCEKENIDFINLFPLFINGENPEIVIKKYYIPNDNHWSEAGHQLVASYLTKYIL